MTAPPPSTVKTAPHRLPAPALFVGPPSRNASNISLPRPGQSRPPTSHVPDSPTSRPGDRPGDASKSTVPPSNSSRLQAPAPPAPASSILDLTRPPNDVPLRPRPSKSSIEAAWSDLQRTLNEVETAAPGVGSVGMAALTTGGAAAAGAAMFGGGHGRALQELREAQIRLAEAWGPTSIGSSGGGEEEADEVRDDASGDMDRDRDADGDDRRRVDARLRRDPQVDLSKAAERAQRNEEYFSKVKDGVLDVVVKLDAVSQAMRKVEGEGREMWEESSLISRDGESQRGVEA